MILIPATLRNPKTLFTLQSLLIFALVPTARTLNRIYSELSPTLKMVLLALLLTLFLYGCFRLLKSSLQKHTLKNLCGFLFSIICLSLIAEWIVVTSLERLHIPLYAALGATGTALFWGKANNLRKTLIATTIVNLLDELLQGLHPERFFDYRDLMINLIGVVIGIQLVRMACGRRE